ncbi:hypothetical protein [Pseudobacteriovorax antillogorgiicola]|uniref:Rap1a immunity protein domain-containing protein n=1 Tax=Pseudobacteriovorax antillogorgiicola TaxID=1513793 RepID=A0A1Y6BCU3_9BACT|nr:hypothetical protein [Pseudobacteriovorax antillogorgiicola]TCS56499.1 hypothetical protein EDD56_104321 [Pseudobacteriovorax antillogorgiicola]SMF04696.1 hypothetical protein SAMN06296036_10412 [Pseudobacteriovorax antillogorgiicola]
MIKKILCMASLAIMSVGTAHGKECTPEEYVSGIIATPYENPSNCDFVITGYEATTVTGLCFPDSLLDAAKRFADRKIPAGIAGFFPSEGGKTPMNVCELYWED